MKHKLSPLNYGYQALEPYIDKETMEIHYTKHHQGYVDKLNSALEAHPELAEKSLEELLKTPNLPEAIRDNVGGHLNHTFFWKILDPKNKFDSQLLKEIEEEFSQVALSLFGSGWTWLAENETGARQIYSLPNQDSPLSLGHRPILGLDVWEHAYYLKYQNRRADYVEAFFSLLKAK